jgi:chromosome partitioning protein
MPRIVAFISQKGGVGKTTLTMHCAYRAAETGRSVLLVDLDTQGNATTALLPDRVDLLHLRGGAADLFNKPLQELEPIRARNIDLLWGHQYLDGLLPDAASVMRLRPALGTLPYDFVLIDTPPAIGPRQIFPLLLANVAVIPIEPNAFALQGLALTLPTIELVKQTNPSIRFRIVINKLQRSSGSQKRYLKALADRSGGQILEPHLTLRVAVGDALASGSPVWSYRGTDAHLAQAWRGLCDTILGL